MSVASELSTLVQNKNGIKAAIEAKSPTVAPTGDLSQWPSSIASIQGGGGGKPEQSKTVGPFPPLR